MVRHADNQSRHAIHFLILYKQVFRSQASFIGFLQTFTDLSKTFSYKITRYSICELQVIFQKSKWRLKNIYRLNYLFMQKLVLSSVPTITQGGMQFIYHQVPRAIHISIQNSYNPQKSAIVPIWPFDGSSCIGKLCCTSQWQISFYVRKQ